MTIIHFVSNNVWGGGEQYVFNLAQRQIEEGNDVVLVTKDILIITDRYKELGAKIIVAPLKGFWDLRSVLVLRHHLSKVSQAVIHVHNFKDAFTAVYFKVFTGQSDVKVIVTRHLVRNSKTSLVYRWLYRHIDAIIFVSKLAKNTFLSSHPQIRDNKLHVVYNRIVPGKDEALVDLLKDYGIISNGPVIMFIGRVVKEKGIFVLFEALQYIRNLPFTLLVVGSGSSEDMNRLHQTACRYGVDGKVHFLGFHQNIHSLIPLCDFGIFPSIVPEAFPLTVLEFFSGGKPVIASNHGGQVEFLSDGINGLYATMGNPKDLAEKMETLLLNPELVRSMGERAYETFIEKQDYDKFYYEIMNIYRLS